MFEMFRRRRRGLLAALTILAMLAFAFPVSDYFRGSDPSRQAPVELVDTVFGRPVTSEDIARARFNRQVANAFVYHSLVAVGERIPAEFQDYVDMEIGFGLTRDDGEITDAIRRAAKADQFGIKISDDAVRDFIKQLTGDRLSGEQFRAVLKSISTRVGQEISDELLFDILRGQLRMRRASHLALGGGRSGAAQVTPYEAWQFYRELNDKLVLEAIAVPADDFAGRVDDPGDETLQQLYSKYIGQLAAPGSPEPGFKEPRKVHIQYATVALADFALAWKPETEISDEEVRQYYESNKPLYRVIAAPAPPPPPPSEVPEKPDAETPKSEDTPDAKKPDADPANAKPPEKSGDAPAKPDDKSNTDPPCTGQEPPASEPKTNEPPDDPKKPAPQEPDKSDDPANAAAAGNSAAPKPDMKDDEPQYRPLEEVSDEIRDTLQREKARTELIKRLDRVGKTVNDYGVKVFLPAKDRHEVAKETKPDAKFEPPEPPDFATACEDLGLRFVDTGAVTLDQELSKLEGIGTATELRGGRSFGRDLTEVMRVTDLFDPLEFRNVQDEYFVAWKIADLPESEPPFQQIREKVLAAYQQIQARELASEHAAKLAQAIREASGDLEKFREQHPDVATVTIGPTSLWTNTPSFSMNSLGRPGPVRPNDLPGIEYPTEQMRDDIFKLKESEVAVAANEPEDTVYVILLKERSTASREEFARSRPLVEEQLRSRHNQEMYRQWLDVLRAESGGGSKKTVPSGN